MYSHIKLFSASANAQMYHNTRVWRGIHHYRQFSTVSESNGCIPVSDWGDRGPLVKLILGVHSTGTCNYQTSVHQLLAAICSIHFNGKVARFACELYWECGGFEFDDRCSTILFSWPKIPEVPIVVRRCQLIITDGTEPVPMPSPDVHFSAICIKDILPAS